MFQDANSILRVQWFNVRKIIHVDMDAFYASVEQRDYPQLRGKPVIVAWRGNRSVVCALRSVFVCGSQPSLPSGRLVNLASNTGFVSMTSGLN